MIQSRLRQLRFAKEEAEHRKLTYEVLTAETGLSAGTLARLFGRDGLDRIDGGTLSTLCDYFGVGVGDVLVYVPTGAKATAGAGQQVAA